MACSCKLRIRTPIRSHTVDFAHYGVPMSAPCWYHFLYEPRAGDRDSVITSLAQAGIEPECYSTQTSADAPESFGVVFFKQYDPSIQDFLHYSSPSGRHRIIAVADSTLDRREIWSLMQAGAADVIQESGVLSQETISKIASRITHWQRVNEIIESPRVASNLIGRSGAWRSALRELVDAALDPDLSVLITGESGTGKELAAQLIHSIDPQRKDARFVVVDCTTIVPELSGSEFFGHERGSFTGAIGRREGAFSLADRGTLFLDEVGELPLLLQAELLRVVQEKRYKPVGANSWKKADFRLICATNRDLGEQQRQGRFRSDLYHRIATWTCSLPPLRDRAEDIIPLAEHFLAINERSGNEPPTIDHPVSEYLRQRDYSGNVRELYQLVRRIVCRSAGAEIITCGDIPESDRPKDLALEASWMDGSFENVIRRAIAQGADLDEIRRRAEEVAEMIALQQAGENGKRNGAIARAAKMLNINRRTLEMHIKNRSDRIRAISH
jgi:transcriptional regulator with GAF, ATPase, and Fis domain